MIHVQLRPFVTRPGLPVLFPRILGTRFIGVTATGRRIPCTVAEDGTYSADTHEVTRLVGWLPL